jgi:hypothetical protein
MKVCEHEFEREDPRKPGYSTIEIDLAANLNGLAIRKNIRGDKYEIYNHLNGAVVYSYTELGRILRTANKLEGRHDLTHECGFRTEGCKRTMEGRCVRRRER